MLEKYAQTIVNRRYLVIIMTLLWAILAAYGSKNLAFTTEYRVFFDPSNPQLQDFEQMQNTYEKSDNVLMLITAKDGKVFSHQTLSQIQWATEQAWQTPYSTRVDSISNYQYTAANGDDIKVADLIGELTNYTSQQLNRLEQIATSEPMLVNRLINPTATVTAINITTQLPAKSIDEVPQVVRFVRDLAAKIEARDSNLTVHLTGIVMLNNAFGESAMKDMNNLVLPMFILVMVLLGVLLRSYSATLVSITMITLSILIAMGIFGWMGYKLTAPTASAPTIILTMAVADAVHMLVSFIAAMKQGKSKEIAMVESIKTNMKPIFLTSFTTMVGFLTMNASEVPPLVHLGNIVAIGVAAAFILSVTLLPALTVALPIKIKPLRNPNQADAMSKVSDFVINHRVKLLVSMVLFSIIITLQVPRNQLNDQFVKYFDTSLDFRIDTDYATQHLTGPYTIEYSLNSGQENGINDPKFMQTLADFAEYSIGLNDVVHVNSITDTMRRLNKNMHGDDPNEYRLPQARDLSAQYLVLYEMSLPYGQDLNNQLDISKSSTRITLSLREMSTKDMLKLEQTLNQWLDQNATDYSYYAASASLMFSHIGERNAKSLVGGAIIALVIISLLLIIALKSIKMGLISLVPNLVPAGIAFGSWGLLDGQIGMSVSIVASMTLGIVVDDTVHFLSKYTYARQVAQKSPVDAIRYAFAKVGQALIVTTIVLVCGFSVLAVSSFRMNADMGLLTAITIATALIVDFLLLPALLLLLDRTPKPIANTATNTIEGAQNDNTAKPITA